MFHCSSFGQVKKVVMLFILLMFSTLSQAESSDNAASHDSATKSEAGLKSVADDQQRDFKFPDWPERQQSNRQMIPPPPPGPYMSSALSDFSVRGTSFGRNSDRHEWDKPVFKLDPSNIPMDTFSPDRPWPESGHKKHMHNRDCAPGCSPSRWLPENGYQYVKPEVKNKPYPAVQDRLPARIPGRMPGRINAAPDMNWPGSRLPPSRLPPVGSAANRAYPQTQNYAPR